MGGTGSKREDHVLTVFMEKKTSAKFSYLPYKSGGEAATQLVRQSPPNPTSNNPQRKSRGLARRPGPPRSACFDKERISYKTKVTDTQSWKRYPDLQGRGASTYNI